jgi:hypothetical protein
MTSAACVNGLDSPRSPFGRGYKLYPSRLISAHSVTQTEVTMHVHETALSR